jgi:DNA polymerase-3 subunit gamma/tau
MLSQASFNAFLKTLEEPPPYAIFILATTEKHKIIPTILSRCQIFDFRRIQVPDIVSHLQKICDTENIVAEPDALHIIAQKADGALRDALSIFDRIVSASGKKLAYSDVIENLNILDYDYFFRITDALLAEDVINLLLIFDDILRKGFDAELFINGLAEHLRNLLVCKDAHTLTLLEAGESLRERYRLQATLSPNSFIITALNLCNDCDINFKAARNKRLHTEMALIKMAYISRSVDLLAMAKGIQNGSIQLAEKKNNDSTAIKPTPTPPQYPSENMPQQRISDKTSERISDNDVPEATPEAAQNAIVTTYNITPNIQNKNNGLLETPALGSLDSIEKMLKVNEELLRQAVQPLTLEALKTSWNKYAGSSVDSPSLRINLESAKLELQGKQIVARIGAALGTNLVQQEAANIMNFLRFEFNTPDLILEVRFDGSLAPDESRSAPLPTRRFLSPREKLIKMMEINPLVKEFAHKFKLKPDES